MATSIQAQAPIGDADPTNDNYDFVTPNNLAGPVKTNPLLTYGQLIRPMPGGFELNVTYEPIPRAIQGSYNSTVSLGSLHRLSTRYNSSGNNVVILEDAYDLEVQRYTTTASDAPTIFPLANEYTNTEQTEEPVFNCKTCFKIFGEDGGKDKNTRPNLKRHMDEKHNSDHQRSECPYCDGTLSGASNLRPHIERKHPDDALPPRKRSRTSA